MPRILLVSAMMVLSCSARVPDVESPQSDGGVTQDAGGPDGGPTDAGAESDGGPTDAGAAADGGHARTVEVSGGLDGGPGGVLFDPAELAWRCLPPDWRTPANACANGERAQPGQVSLPDGGTCANSYPPCLAGDTLRIEDVIRFLADLPALKTVALTSTGVFQVAQVDVTNTTLALAGYVGDSSGLTLESGNLLGRPPLQDHCDPSIPGCLEGRTVRVVSREFVAQLAEAIHQDLDSMLAQGVVIIHVVEADGVTGVAGAKINHVYADGTPNETTPELTDDLYYVNDALTDSYHPASAGDPTSVTSAAGLAVRLNAGNAQLYTATLGASRFAHVLNGSRPGTVTELFLAR